MQSKLPKLIECDPWLEPSTHDIIERTRRFEEKLQMIKDSSDSILKFASAYQYLGIHFDSKNRCWTYREWAPAAKALYLTGDFNHWHQTSHLLKRLPNGVWEIHLDYDQYKESFVHESFIKVMVLSDLGFNARIPAYITRVVQDQNTKDFSGQLWFPGRFNWEKDNFNIGNLEQLFIYEAHVGMATERMGIGTYSEFAQNVLPRIKASGYNAIQLMAIQEHPYYGSFGYHVANFFAPSSRFGTPEELKELIKKAHSMGLAVIMDLVHSHTVKNINEGLNNFDGSDNQYFHKGPRGYHTQWDSKCFDYGKYEVIQFLLSNIKYWLTEFHFDGFRFDGVGSMLYFHHGMEPIDTREKFFRDGVEFDAVTYLQLANYLTHKIYPKAITISEDVTGMPGTTFPPKEGGLGFNYRLGMGLPDFWIRYLKELKDEDWNIYEMWNVMNDRLPFVKTVAYAESHDQALVGDKTLAFWLMDKEMYFSMQESDKNIIVDRGMALHKMIRLFTITLGGQAYLNFMGNEFGHPEWIDFPREDNNWSYEHARRQWSLLDNKLLKYKYLYEFDKAMIKVISHFKIMISDYARQLNMDNSNKCIIFERGNLIFVFNFHPVSSIFDYHFSVPETGDYKIILNSDGAEFGGFGRINDEINYPTVYNKNNGSAIMRLYLPNRTALVLKKI